jgi:hypothetical protein
MHVRVMVIGLLLCASFQLLAADKPQPATTNNNDSCDIGVFPAATLLLPYFEVETVAPPFGTTTLFTITNTSRYPQIAHVTVWTDWAYPVLGFNLFLTGYDVKSINLFDVIVRALIAIDHVEPIYGTSITTVPGSPQPAGYTFGGTPRSNTSNPNFLTPGKFDVSTTCAGLPGPYDRGLNLAVRNALTVGTGYNAGGVNCGSSLIGSNTGTRAKGYITIDVVSYCSAQFPTDPDGSYFAGPAAPLLFDNVLIGDYQQIRPAPAGTDAASTFDAGGNPMVHIRAVPEGGLSGASGGESVATNLPFTFYDRYTPAGARPADRRQPLPSLWAARYIQGDFSAGIATDLKIWREGITAGLPSCSGDNGAQLNSAIALAGIVRFDEHENSYGLSGGQCSLNCFSLPFLPATSRRSTASSLFPTLTGTDLGGWFYLNLSSGSNEARSPKEVCHAVLSAQRAGFGTCNDARVGSSGSRTTSQNWVTTSMFGPVGTNRLSADFDAAALGNGCTPGKPSGAVIAPAGHPGGSLLCPDNARLEKCGVATVPRAPNP